ncbi:lysis protein [Vibrio anguillarum]|uniref:lysis protein n=1 Tax=Vibrio anguillarum TaxID=55601 RepID=UPI00097E3619|nr:lysis protein [Vibrio anguillarum]MBT2946371.1 lysis protein [Vibrio anguillarum]
MSISAYWKMIVAGVITIVIIALFSLYSVEKANRKAVQAKLDKVTEERDSLVDLNNRQIAKIQSFNELSIKHAEEAANAKKEIDSLRADVRNGAKRVFIKASCPEPVPKVDSTRGVGDAGAAEVERAVAEDILDLREMNSKAIRQIHYLQGYIRTQCSLASHSD